MSAYCLYAPTDSLHRPYHDEEYGFHVRDDAALFERLVLEINQAGLSWATILRKRESFRAAYDRFSLDAVAAYQDEDRSRLLNDAGVIRNRLKINAAVENARRLVSIREERGSFAAWLDLHHPLAKPEWVKLFKRTFLFTGGEIVGEFLTSTGYLPGAHAPDCPAYARALASRPPWAEAV